MTERHVGYLLPIRELSVLELRGALGPGTANGQASTA